MVRRATPPELTGGMASTSYPRYVPRSGTRRRARYASRSARVMRPPPAFISSSMSRAVSPL